MRYAAIDLGATFVKGAVLDTDANVLRNVRREAFPAFSPKTGCGHREVDADSVVQVARGLIHRLVQSAPDCAGLWISSQMHGFVLCDGDGNARSPFFSWQDTRSLRSGAPVSFFDLLKSKLKPTEIADLGNELRPGLAISTLFSLRNTGELGRSLTPTPLGDFVVAALAGVRPETSWSQGAGLGACRVAEGCWHDDVLRKSGLDDLCWPRIHREFKPWAKIQCGGTILECYPSVGDQQASLLGVNLRENELSINIATGSQVSAISSEPSVGNFQVRPFFDRKFLRTVTHLPAGRSLNTLVRLLTELSDLSEEAAWKIIAEKVERFTGVELKADISFFPCATGNEGSLTHLTEENLRVGDLFSAAFRAMAVNYREAAERVFPSRAWRRVVFSGGLASKLEPLRKAVLGQIEGPYRLAAESDDSLLGLLALAASTQSGDAAINSRYIHGDN